MLKVSGTSRARKAADVAADDIRRLIADGLVAPGQRLIEAELVDRIGVSRSTLREAFLKLAIDGLVELQHQRGACVRRMTRTAMQEMFELRECLEGYAAGLAATRVRGDSERSSHRAWLEEARAIWAGETVPGDALAHMENNVPLHDGIVAMAGNARLKGTLAQFDMPAYRLRFMRLIDNAELARSAHDHVTIIDAILDGSAARAERAMRAHVRRSGRLALRIPDLD